METAIRPDTVRITNLNGPSGYGTKVFMADGAEIPTVLKISVDITPDLMTASLTIPVGTLELAAAHVLLSRHTLEEWAALSGMHVIPIEEFQEIVDALNE